MGTAQIHFELHYPSLSGTGRSFAFPCDGRGRVDMDRLSTRQRNDYLFARGSVGYALGAPTVCMHARD
jgi:hypothetical protein